jgi:hypothetical protein
MLDFKKDCDSGMPKDRCMNAAELHPIVGRIFVRLQKTCANNEVIRPVLLFGISPRASRRDRDVKKASGSSLRPIFNQARCWQVCFRQHLHRTFRKQDKCTSAPPIRQAIVDALSNVELSLV